MGASFSFFFKRTTSHAPKGSKGSKRDYFEQFIQHVIRKLEQLSLTFQVAIYSFLFSFMAKDNCILSQIHPTNPHEFKEESV